MLTVDQTTRSYTGRPGCMCGCMGTYNEGVQARKMAITALLKSPLVRFNEWSGGTEGAIFVETATRNRVLYLTEEGVRTVQAMGVKPE